MGGANDKRGHTETLWNRLTPVRSSLVHDPSSESEEGGEEAFNNRRVVEEGGGGLRSR